MEPQRPGLVEGVPGRHRGHGGPQVEEIVLDGEAMAHCKDGLPDFHGLRSEDGGAAACLYAFDLLRLDGEDLRPLPLEERRARLRKALRGAGKALRFSEHLEGDGEAIFRHACALGLEGIVSKRRDARYRSGRSLTWLKIKNLITSDGRSPCEILAALTTVKAAKSSL